MPAYLDADTLELLLPAPALIDALRAGFASETRQPPRVHLDVPVPGRKQATLLLMPAWNDRYMGIKTATIHPSNSDASLPSVYASYLLKDTGTGKDLAILEGTMLTRLRTAAASALAASYLARKDTSTLLMVGAGSLAVPLIQAHLAVRPISRIMLWNRTPENASSLKEQVIASFNDSARPATVEVIGDLDQAVSQADVISCATLSTSSLVRGASVKPGTHVDLVGAYRAGMRESDSALITSASVFVDTQEGARHEAGDLLAAETETEWSFDAIQADLSELCSGSHPGRLSDDETTVFKSVGASLEDLVAAQLAWEQYQQTD